MDMSDARKARIAELEAEVQQLRAQIETDHRAMLKARVDTLFQGLHLDDVPVIRELVNEHGSRLFSLEGPDDE